MNSHELQEEARVIIRECLRRPEVREKMTPRLGEYEVRESYGTLVLQPKGPHTNPIKVYVRGVAKAAPGWLRISTFREPGSAESAAWAIAWFWPEKEEWVATFGMVEGPDNPKRNKDNPPGLHIHTAKGEVVENSAVWRATGKIRPKGEDFGAGQQDATRAGLTCDLATALPSVSARHPATDNFVVLPPFEGATEFLDRLRNSRHLPERNMEELVRDLLVRLGHPPQFIEFQVGRIDVRVKDAEGKLAMVIEVKKSLASKKDRDAARRQGFDYAGKSDARLVVLTDADEFEVYDHSKAGSYEARLRGRFRLTAFRTDDGPLFDLLRPGGSAG